MATTQYRKVKCDQCGKEVEMKGDFGSMPIGWFEIEITEWNGSTGEGRFNKEVCSESCALKVLKELKKIPPKSKEPIQIF